MRSVTVVADPGDTRALAGESVRLAGRIVGAELCWTGVAGWLDHAPVADVLLLEAEGIAPDLLAAVLPRIDEVGMPVIASMGLAEVDHVTALLSGPRVQWLCEATIGERVTALTLALADDVGQDEHLTAGIARIADMLTGGKARTAAFGDRRRRWGAPPADTEAIVHSEEVRAAIRARRLRDELFGNGWFEDPAWDILLDLFAAGLERADVSVSSLCIAAAVAPTTALRWITRLQAAGLIERRPDPRDRRRMFIVLSERARGLMRRYWASAGMAASVTA